VYLNEKAGTHRTISGGLTDQAGIIEGLDEIVKEFLAASAEDKKSIVTKAEEIASTLDGSAASHAKTYLKSFKNALEKGDEYAAKEVERLERLLKGAVSPNKVDDFVVKKNILTSFVN
jgi:protein disulfide-isomerase A6